MAACNLRRWLERLAAIDRGSCSPGEREAAELIAAVLREQGARSAVEQARVHGTYWWPLGLTSGLGLLAAGAAARGRRVLAGVLGASGTLLVVDDLGVGRRWVRMILPKRATANVVAEMGDAQAADTLILVAHHDAAHTGFFFNPRITELAARALRRRRAGGGAAAAGPAPMLPIAAGPGLVAAGALLAVRSLVRLGALVCAGVIASFTDMAVRATTPGANDNLTGVVTLLAVAEALRERPVARLRVLLVSTGSEEALMEGMRAFAARHFPALDPARTRLLCIDTVGSPHLVLAEAEGMLQVRPYDADFNDLIGDCAAQAAIPLRRGVTMRLGTDGYVALRHGIRSAMLMSVDDHGVASNYHWYTDTPDRVDYATLQAAVTLCERVVRRVAADAGQIPGRG